MSQAATSAEKGGLVGLLGKAEPWLCRLQQKRPRLRNRAFQRVSRALLEARKHLRGSWKGWGLHIGAKRDLASPKCFEHIGVETRKMFSSFVCLKERVESDGKAQLGQRWGHWWCGRPSLGNGSLSLLLFSLLFLT